MIDSLTERERDVLALLAEGLSNREIAQKLVISAETVKWYNKQIYQKLGAGNRTEAVAVARRYGLLETEGEEGAAGDEDAERDGEGEGRRLPRPLTSFVGREQEIRELEQMLRSKRLVTLTGPGGTGKTRLALAVAAHARAAFGDGARFVDLSTVDDAEQVGPAVVRGLGLQEGRPALETLARFLRPRQLLLILDNFEQVVAAAPLVGELLDEAPRLTVLATSRQPLHLYGEQEYRVEPLPLPQEATADTAALAENASMRLFVARAQAVRPDFAITEENVQALSAICRQLEGLPLAIELAAAQLKLFTPAVLLARLEDRLATLTRGARDLPARQQTLRAALDWSHELLTAEERVLLRRLSVFRGGGALEAIEAVCGEGLVSPVLDVAAALLDKSLIRQGEDDEGNVRIGMLETIREYAQDKLAEAGEVDVMRAKHAQTFLDLAQQAEKDLRAGPRQYPWVRRLMTDYENVCSALTWALGDGEAELGVALTGALGNFWFRSGLHWEGARWTERALNVVEKAPPSSQARLYRAAGIMAWPTHGHERGRLYDEKALALFRELGDDYEIAWAMVYLAAQWIGIAGGYEKAGPRAQEALQLLQEMGDLVGAAQALNVLGELARIDGHDDLARGYYEEALALARATGDRLREVLQLQNLGYLAQRAGAYEEAEDLFLESVEAACGLSSRFALAYTLTSLAGAYAATRPERAARLMGFGERIFEELGALPDRGDREVFKENRTTARETLGEKAYAAALARGRAMSMREAVAYALEEDHG